MFLRSLSIILLSLATVGCGEKNDPNPTPTAESSSELAAKGPAGAEPATADKEPGTEVESRVDESRAVYYVISEA